MAPQYVVSVFKVLAETQTIYFVYVVAYFTHDSLDYLRTVSDIPDLARIDVPAGQYRSARHNPSKQSRAQREERSYSLAPQYAPYPSPPRIVPQRVSGLPHASSSPQRTDYSRRALPWGGQALAPLEYLQNLAPPRRHPMDEKALMALYPDLS